MTFHGARSAGGPQAAARYAAGRPARDGGARRAGELWARPPVRVRVSVDVCRCGAAPLDAPGCANRYVHFNVDVPVKPTERQKELIREFGEEQVISDDDRADRRDRDAGRRGGRRGWSFG